MREPRFWRQGGAAVPAILLAPLSVLYGAGTILRRRLHRPYRPPVPVVVAGGLTLGGAGKTPLALALADLLRDRHPHFLSRGYGGREHGPLRVDPARHDSAQVGDEPLLLAASAPAWIGRDRAAAARTAVAAGAGLLILDDGFQNPSLAKDLSLLAVDGQSGIGNGRVFPAGPLREPLSSALVRADAAVVIGEDSAGIAAHLAGRCPIVRARLIPAAEGPALAGRRVYAFAGIGRPEKFFASLQVAGAVIAGRRTFADHHAFTRREIDELTAAAKSAGADLVTTAKDRLRLPKPMRETIAVLEIRLVFEDVDAIESLLRRI